MRTIFFILFVALITACANNGSSIADPPIGIGAEEPSLTVTEHGLVLSWMEPSEGDIFLKMSLHNGIKWSPVKTIAKGDDWFVNWADFPAIVANGNLLFAHFLQKSAQSTYAYDVMITISQNMGETWSTPKKLHQDTVAAEHGFVSAVPFDDGFYVSWLDGRYTTEEHGAMTIRAAYVDGKGKINYAAEIDHNTCDCCQTAMANVNGVPWSLYRNRTEEEVRDMYYSKLVEGQWSEPEVLHADNWLINACPVNGPEVSTYNKTLAVVWYTGADGEHKTKMKISHDEGNSFGDVILVDSPMSFGRVDVQMDSANVYVTYLTKKDASAAIMLKVYDHSGVLQLNEILAVVSPGRGTGFPRMALWYENLIITWTDVEQHTIKVLEYPLNKKHIGTRAGFSATN